MVNYLDKLKTDYFLVLYSWHTNQVVKVYLIKEEYLKEIREVKDVRI